MDYDCGNYIWDLLYLEVAIMNWFGLILGIVMITFMVWVITAARSEISEMSKGKKRR